jgi:hypothetical protein
VKFLLYIQPRFPDPLDHMSDETTTENAAPSAAPSKKKSAKDPMAAASMLIGVLGVLAAIASIVVSLMF